MYIYGIKRIRVVDGDTIEADVDLGFGVTLEKKKFRILNLDTYESRKIKRNDIYVTDEEVKLGKEATRVAIELLTISNIRCITTHKEKTGKFGRYLAHIELVESNCSYALMMRERGFDRDLDEHNARKKE